MIDEWMIDDRVHDVNVVVEKSLSVALSDVT
jgi:hypothetical protein